MNADDPASSSATQTMARQLAVADQGVLAAEWPAPSHVGLLTTLRAPLETTLTSPLRTTPRTTTRASEPIVGMEAAETHGDAPSRRETIQRRLRGMLPSEPVWLAQVHGNHVVVLDATTLSSARAVPPVADAVVTRLSGVVCAVLTADCLPVALTDRDGTAIGLAHAGWRGLAAGVLEATVQALTAQGITPSDLVAWLGPAIGPASFEVGVDVMSAFCDRDPAAAACFVPHREGKWHADLYGLARRRLDAAGVHAIHGGGLCTYADAVRFPSYRRDHAAERMATLLWRAD